VRITVPSLRPPRRRLAPPTVETTRTVALLASGILSGALVIIAVLDVPLGRSPQLYLQYRRATTEPLTRLLPPLGGATLLATAATAWRRGRPPALLGAAACLLAGLSLTVAVHFPLNAAILAWEEPPPDWAEVRDRWRAAHAVRTVAAVAAFVLLADDLRRHPRG
jgi:Domain of unknown function (DUF1772)